MKITRWAALAAAMVAVVALAGCSSSSTPAPVATGPFTVRINYGDFPATWAPGGSGEPGYLRVPYETLVTLVDGVVTPVLATSWEQTATSLTLHLRQGVLFHDGTAFDAAAVKANLEYVQSTPGQYSATLSSIGSIDVVDQLTVKLTLTRPDASLLTTLTTRAALMASPKAIADGSIATTPVGTGAWAYDQAHSTADRLVFTYFPHYWGGRASVGFDTIELYAMDDKAATQALASGQLDISEVEPGTSALLDQTLGVESVAYPAVRNNIFFFDRAPGGIFADVTMRRAACYALDTRGYSHIAADMLPRTQHFSSGEVGYNPDITGYPHDVAQAQQQAAGRKISFSMLTLPLTQVQVDTYAQQLHDTLGWDVTTQQESPQEWATQWSANPKEYAAGVGINNELTPFDWYADWFAADAPGNPAGVESDELKAAADEAIAAGDSTDAARLWAKVTKVINDEALTCAYVVGGETIVWQSLRVTGVEPPNQPWEEDLVEYHTLRPAA